MLFKKPVTQSEQLQTTEDDFHREDNGDYEPEVDDYDETDAEHQSQTRRSGRTPSQEELPRQSGGSNDHHHDAGTDSSTDSSTGTGTRSGTAGTGKHSGAGGEADGS